MANVVLIFVAVLALSRGAYCLNEVSFTNVPANEFADQLISKLRGFMIGNGFDPLTMPHLEMNGTFNWLFQEHEWDLTLDNGVVLNLSNMMRGGDCTVGYDFGLLNIQINIVLPSLHGTAAFDMSVLGLNPDGTATFTITEQQVVLGLLIDLDQTTVRSQNCALPNNGKLDLHLDGMGILEEALYNVLIKAVSALFHDKIMGTVSDTVCGTLSNFLVEIAPILPACVEP